MKITRTSFCYAPSDGARSCLTVSATDQPGRAHNESTSHKHTRHHVSTRPTIPAHLLNSPFINTPHQSVRHFSTGSARSFKLRNESESTATTGDKPKLTHLTASGAAHMVSLPPPVALSSISASSGSKTSHKPPTHRVAIAISVIRFSSSETAHLIVNSLNKKGDVLGVARIAGISGAKETSRLIPLCHNILISGVEMNVEVVEGAANVEDAADADQNQPLAADEKEASLSPILSREKAQLATARGGVVITARVHTFGQTGVEMEALTAASLAGLTVYDMCKAVDKGMRMDGVRVVLKSGGGSGNWIENEHGVIEKQ